MRALCDRLSIIAVVAYCETGQEVWHGPVFGHVGVLCLDCNANCNSITYSNADTDTFADADRNRNRYGYSDAHCHGDFYSYTDSYICSDSERQP
jgi:hypothetical protein